MDTKKLRQKILDLAIRGKLVPQDPNDEPASVLLERIRAEKERLIKEGKIKRSKKSASDDEIEAPFEIPESWEWCIVDDFSYVAAGSTPSKDAFVENGIPYIKMYNLRNQKIDFYFHPQYIKPEVHNGKLQRSRTEVGDLIMNIVGPPLGKMAIIPQSLSESNFNQAAVLIRPYLHKEILVKYLFYYLSQMSEINSISTKGSAGQVNISLTQSQNMRVAMPPLSEQKRIINEVERWFTLIDELESNEGDLLKAIDKAKSKILDLAIHGKLVPQDPNDEPAIELLKRSRALKGKIKRSKKSASDDEIEAPFEIPESWEWVRLDALCDIKGGKRIPHGMTFSKVPTEHVYLRVTNMKCHTIIENEIKYIDEEVFQIIKNYTISSDDLYLTIAGTIGDVGEIPLKFSNMNLTENAAKLTNLLCD